MAAGQEKNDGHAGHQAHTGVEDPEKKISVGRDHESLAALDESETETLSQHHDDHSHSQDDDEEDRSRHSTDETEAHHDPEPEGPEGLNTGIIGGADGLMVRSRSRSRAQSRASSTRSRTLTIVPRTKRRGLFAQFTLIPEVERPYDYSRKTKWTITAIVALAAAGGPIGSNIMYRMCISSSGRIVKPLNCLQSAGIGSTGSSQG